MSKSDVPICPCEGLNHPQLLFNRPGQSILSYRVGDYASFRQALLQALPNESELHHWRPGAEGDLALQLVEWWAYLADILTFYNERIAHQAYLRTADLPESLSRLIRLLGYRPRPGIGARGELAALLVNPGKPLILPEGFSIQSKPGPGQQPQIFELDSDTQIDPPAVIPAAPVADDRVLPIISTTSNSLSVLLKGTVTTVQAGDALLLKRLVDNTYVLVNVQSVAPETAPRSKVNTRVTFTYAIRGQELPSNARVSEYRLLKSTQSGHLWPYSTNSNIVIQPGVIALPIVGAFGLPRFSPVTILHLESIARQIRAGDVILLVRPGKQPMPLLVQKYEEQVWYANGDPADPAKPPSKHPENEPLIPITHSVVTASPKLGDGWDEHKQSMTVHYGWQEVGELLASPVTSVAVTAAGGITLNPVLPASILLPELTDQPVLLEDANKQGAKAIASTSAGNLSLTNLTHVSGALTPPLRVLTNRLPVSRGQTIPREILGSGNAAIAGQEFMLQKTPLTYLPGKDPKSGATYISTLRIWVDGVEWQEVPSFYDQSPKAQVFVTREDEEHRTHVLFGDGINGTRLPSGVNNVVARYRYGSGTEAPEAGSLNVILKPYPNLKAILNPVLVGGGADPDPPAQIRRYAPRSVLTFGRAVSRDDYETTAAQAPGVARARAYWRWNAEQQRSLVEVYVGDDVNAVESAKTALRGAGDPNRPVQVLAANPIPIRLTLTLHMDPIYDADRVSVQVQQALTDPDAGLFGDRRVRIGQVIYQSQIYAACVGVAGVLAVRDLRFQFLVRPTVSGPASWIEDSQTCHNPGEGGFYQLMDWDKDLNIQKEEKLR